MRLLPRRPVLGQQQLRFSNQEIWQALTTAQRDRCHQLLVDLLLEVMRREHQQGGKRER